jgi:uncharacterized Zn finger protein (UPF0148 family)
MRPDALGGEFCGKCGAPKMIRPDAGILCADCEKKALQQFEKIRPDIAKKGKLELRWQPKREKD